MYGFNFVATNSRSYLFFFRYVCWLFFCSCFVVLTSYAQVQVVNVGTNALTLDSSGTLKNIKGGSFTSSISKPPTFNPALGSVDFQRILHGSVKPNHAATVAQNYTAKPIDISRHFVKASKNRVPWAVVGSLAWSLYQDYLKENNYSQDENGNFITNTNNITPGNLFASKLPSFMFDNCGQQQSHQTSLPPEGYYTFGFTVGYLAHKQIFDVDSFDFLQKLSTDFLPLGYVSQMNYVGSCVGYQWASSYQNVRFITYLPIRIKSDANQTIIVPDENIIPNLDKKSADFVDAMIKDQVDIPLSSTSSQMTLKPVSPSVQTSQSVTLNPDGSTTTTTTNQQLDINYKPTNSLDNNDVGQFITNIITTTTTTNNVTNITTTTTTTTKPPEPEPEPEPAALDDPDMPDIPDFYKQQYKDGFIGVYDKYAPLIKSTNFFRSISVFFPSFSDGSSFPSFNFLVFGNTYSVVVPAYVVVAIRSILLILTVFYCRRIILGR